MAQNKSVEELSYKEASIELEGIIRNLESGDLELEESLEGYTRGVELLKSLRTRLAAAEQKVSVLMKDIDGGDTWSPASLPTPRTALVSRIGAWRPALHAAPSTKPA